MLSNVVINFSSKLAARWRYPAECLFLQCVPLFFLKEVALVEEFQTFLKKRNDAKN